MEAFAILAEDTWTLERKAEIAMDWSMRLTGVRAVVPPNTQPLLQAPARTFVSLVNARTEPWDLGFTLTLREAQFAGAATLDAQQIWAGTLESFLKESIRLEAPEIDRLKQRARSGLSTFESYIKQRDEKRASDQQHGSAATDVDGRK